MTRTCPNIVLRFALLILFMTTPGLAPGAEMSLKVDEISLCGAIRNRAPVGVADTFPCDIYVVYCYTVVSGAEDSTAVRHAWYFGEVKVIESILPVKASYWRTWSRKLMKPEWKGSWRVDVLALDGAVLASKKFVLK